MVASSGKWEPLSQAERHSAFGLYVSRPSAPTAVRASAAPSPLLRLSVQLAETCALVNPSHSAGPTSPPARRLLTKPSTRSAQCPHDNELGDLVVSVSDVIRAPSGEEFEVLSALGKGTFGQVFKVRPSHSDECFALKVIRNRRALSKQAEMEVKILNRFRIPDNCEDDPSGSKSEGGKDARALIVQLRQHFYYQDHACLVFEALGVNLLQLLQQNGCRGLSISLVRFFAKQLLQALVLLRREGIMHCDLKPENILLRNLQSPTIKIIDFGSACYAAQRPTSTYIQSRFYRSPEVLLGHPYGVEVDTWSLGCIVGEFFLGLPLFPGESEYNQLLRVVEMLGVPSDSFLSRCSLARKFFEPMRAASTFRDEVSSGAPTAVTSCAISDGADGTSAKRTLDGNAASASSVLQPPPSAWRLKPEEEYAREMGVPLCRNKQYFRYKLLPDLITRHPPRKPHATVQEADAESERRCAMLSFLFGLLQFDPSTRWRPCQAIQHPFITGAKYTGRFAGPQAASTTEAKEVSVSKGDGRDRLTIAAVPDAAPAAAQAPGSATRIASSSAGSSKPQTPAKFPGNRDKHPKRCSMRSGANHGSSPQQSPQASPRLMPARSSPMQRITLPVGMVGGHTGGSPPGSFYASPQSTSPPAYFPSPPLSLSPPSMQTIHVALSTASPGGWQQGPPPHQQIVSHMHGGWTGGSHSPSPAIPVMVPMSHSQHAPQTFFGVNTGNIPPNVQHGGGMPSIGGFVGGYSPDGIHLASSPPDRSMLPHHGNGIAAEVIGHCAQCNMWRTGHIDESDSRLYCHSCWGEYNGAVASSGAPRPGLELSEQSAREQPGPAEAFVPFRQMYSGYQQGPGPAPPMRLAVNTGGERSGGPPTGGSRGDRSDIERSQARRPQVNKVHLDDISKEDGGTKASDKREDVGTSKCSAGEGHESSFSFEDVFTG